jgi:glycosyltransferase involved in cell wall biosynthesis
MISTKAKILFVFHLPPPIHGSSVVGQYIKDSHTINNTFNCRYIDMGTSTRVDEIGKRNINKFFRYLFILVQVITQLILFRPKLCYLAITAKGPGFYKDSLVAILVKLFGVKLVCHFHNKGISTRQSKFIDNLLYWTVLKNTEVILLSRHLYSDIQKYIPEERVHYCPNGIPEQSLSFNNIPLKKDNNIVHILFLSNLMESKGVYVLLDACKMLQDQRLPFHCTFVGGEGDVNKQNFQKKVESLGLNTSTNYVGKKYGREKEAIFSVSDIFVFPTYYETFGLVNLEAMQFSLPVVSTFEGGIPDIVEDGVTGYLVPQKDVNALAEKLKVLICNPKLRKQMGLAGRIKYKQYFTLKIFESRLKNILNEIINND